MRPAKTTVIHFSTQMGRSLTGFLATLYFANVLGADILGKYFVAIALVAWLKIPSDAISTATNKRVSEGRTGRESLGAGILLNTIFAFILIIVIIAFQDLINSYVGDDVAIVLAGLVFVRISFQIVLQGLEGQKKVAYSGVIQFLDQLLRAIFQVVLIYIGFRLLGLIIGHTIALTIAIVIGLMFYQLWPKWPEKQHLTDIIDFAQYSWLGTIKTRAYSWMDVLVLNIFVASALVGIYQVAWSLASVLVLVNVSIQKATFPEISHLSEQSEQSRVHNLLEDGLLFTGIFTIPGFFGAAIVGPELLKLYGDEFIKAHLILLILIAGRALDVYGSVLINTINAVDRPNRAFRINLIFTVSNIGLNILLIYLFGWYGAAFATTISSTIVLLLSYKSLKSIIGGIRVPYIEISKQLIAAMIMSVILIIFKMTVPWSGTIVTLGLVTIGVITYFLTLGWISISVRHKVKEISSVK